MRREYVFSPRTYTVHVLLRVPLDGVRGRVRQVNGRKWLAFNSPFKFGICQSRK